MLTMIYTRARTPLRCGHIYQGEYGGDAMAPNESDILREQLDYLIEHTAREVQCGCSECRRYLRARSILLEIFEEPQHVPLAKAA